MLLFAAKSCPTSWSDVTLLPGDALRMRAGARCVRSMTGRDSTNRLGEGTVGAPLDGIDYVDAFPGCCQRPRRGGRSRRSRFGHLRRSVFGAAGTHLALACPVSNIIRAPAHVGDHLRVEADVAERHLTIVECRPPWRADVGPEWTRFPIAVAVHEGGGGSGRCTGGIATFASTTTTGAADGKR